MQPMTVQPECYACLLRMADLTVNLASRDPEKRAQARERSRAIIRREFRPAAVPALIANRLHRAIREQTGNADPYSSRKQAETAYLRRMYTRIAPAYQENLDSLLRLAVVGNAIDYFRNEEEVTREILTPVAWSQADLEPLRRRLEESRGTLLYLADNAGEQFFDLPLVAYVRSRGWQTLFVVKGGPVQNDLTRDDLSASGLGEALEPLIDTGARTVGLVLAETSAAFQKIYAEADLILAKGMGHFETMSHFPDPRVFFLLQAKCPPVAQALGVPHRGFVLRQAAGADSDCQK
ncbi:MAG: damage-control phosphatase ARMT1 family protein [Desulfobaccales bacterium]